MTSAQPLGAGRVLLWLSPALLVAAGFLAATPWLRDLDDAVIKLLAAATSIFVMAWSLMVAIRCQRRADEVERAGERYAFHVGGVAGWIVTIVLLTIPPIQNLLIEAANVVGTGSAESSDRESVTLALFMGACLLIGMQALGAGVAGLVWKRRVGWR